MQASNDPFDSSSNQHVREDLAAAHRWAVRHELNEGICNHFTAMVPGKPEQFFVLPYGLHWAEARASHFMETGFDGKVRAGSGDVEVTAYCIHAPLHQARSDAKVVLHTHMPYASALTRLEDPTLRNIGQTELGMASLAAYDTEYNGLALDPSEGHRMARVLGPKAKVLFLAHHGVITIGKTVGEAYDLLYFVERACKSQLFALWTGQRLKTISQEVVTHTLNQHKGLPTYTGGSTGEMHLKSLRRLLDADPREDTYRQ